MWAQSFGLSKEAAIQGVFGDPAIVSLSPGIPLNVSANSLASGGGLAPSWGVGGIYGTVSTR